MAELGETTDPKALVPGEPGEIRKSTAHLTTYGDAMQRVGGGLQRLDTGGWTGQAADAFHARFNQEPGRWTEAGEAFHAARQAIEGYAGVLEWAQGQAAEAIGLWQQGEQATAAAKAQHDQQVAAANEQAVANGQPAPPTPPFNDPGEAMRAQARQMVDQARAQVTAAGDQAVGAVDRAQERAPQEPSILEDVVNAFGDAFDYVNDHIQEGVHELGQMGEYLVEQAGEVVGGFVEDAGDLAATVVSGVGDDAGKLLSGLGSLTGSEDLQSAGRTMSQTANALGDAVSAATSAAAHEVREAAEDAGDRVKEEVDDFGAQLTGRDHGPHGSHYVVIDEDRYPESADHIRDAQSGEIWRGDQSRPGAPMPSEVTIDRDGADFNRREALRGIPGRGGDYLDRDEYPPAVFEEGGQGSSVKYIDASDNRGSGASMKNQMRGLDDGDEVTIVVG